MKVYVLIEWDYEDATLRGVYSSLEAAKRAQAGMDSVYRMAKPEAGPWEAEGHPYVVPRDHTFIGMRWVCETFSIEEVEMDAASPVE